MCKKIGGLLTSGVRPYRKIIPRGMVLRQSHVEEFKTTETKTIPSDPVIQFLLNRTKDFKL